VAVAFLSGCFSTVVASPAAADDIRSAVSPSIDAFVAQRMEARGTPGVSVAVVRAGRTIHLAGYGRADSSGRSVTPDTKFLLGSVSKPFTAAALSQLVADGRLSLDEPVEPYVEAVVGHELPDFDGITVGQLLDHTSGLPNALGLPGSVPVRPGADALRWRIADLAVAHRRDRPPGHDYEYSNANYILLASVIEQVSGVPFDEYVYGRLFEPLGMTSSFASDADGRTEGLATGHES
jgi:CubicO group peptidase (beta-lactamase class C family)